jgi:transcription initiation factor TFIIH subunit 2
MSSGRKRAVLVEDHEGDATNENGAIYKWEKGVVASWEVVKEDAEGNVIIPVSSSERERSHALKKSRITESVRRGLIRFVVLVLDSSMAAHEKDYRPSRLEVCKNALERFILNFYDQNPISQLSLIVTKDRLADKVTDLSGNSKSHVHKLQNIFEVKGLASLQHTISLATGILKHIPSYGSREMVILFSSLSSCDPGNIYETVEVARKLRIRINIICLSAEIFICKRICELTNGFFAVALDPAHLQDLLSVLLVPPVDLASPGDSTHLTDFIYMGFPKKSFEQFPFFGFEGKRDALATSAFVCPRCLARSTDIPTQCAVCALQLNSSSHIARSFHHLFPVRLFLEYTVRAASSTSLARGSWQPADFVAELYDFPPALEESQEKEPTTDAHQEEPQTPPPPPPPNDSPPPPPPPPLSPDSRPTKPSSREARIVLSRESERCRGCWISLLKSEKVIFRCPSCGLFFCLECDLFIHETLHNCPGCQ